MRLEQLIHLIKASESKSLTHASAQLYLTQQALSHSLKQLEEELGTQLLERSYLGTSLTKDGEYALAIAKQVIALTDELAQHFRPSPKNCDISGHLSIMALPIIKEHLLAKSISYFYKHLPKVNLIITQNESTDIIDALLAQKAQLGFISILKIQEEEKTQVEFPLHFVPFANFKYSALISEHSPLAKYKSLSIAHLLKYPIVLMPTTTLENYIPYQIFKYYGCHNLIIADNFSLFNQMIIDDLGCSIVPNRLFSDESAPHTLTRPLKDPITSAFGYLINTLSPDTLLRDRFIKIFFDTLG